MGRLRDKVVLITGASSGLGEQIAYESAKQDAVVVVSARRLDKLEIVRDRCAAYSGRRAAAYKLDVRSKTQIQSVLDAVYDEFGQIDVLVNNAGFGCFEEALHMDMDLAEEMFRVNVFGLMYMTQLVARKMAERKQGHIINIASQGGKIATPKSAVYSATKAAVIGYSNALRLELKPQHIFVTTVNPGPIKTDFFAAADKTGDYLKNVGSVVLNPQTVAVQVVEVMLTSRREVNMPRIMEVGARMYNLFPHLGDYLARTIFNKK